MSKGDVRRALLAMDHDEVRGHLASGDFSDVESLELDDHERQLIRGAAEEYPDVAGFAFEAYVGIQGLKQGKFDLTITPSVQKVFDYCATGKHIPEAQL